MSSSRNSPLGAPKTIIKLSKIGKVLTLDEPFEVVEVTVDAVTYSNILHLQGNSVTVLKYCFMHLAYTGCSERIKIDLSEVLLPIFSVFSVQDLANLL